MHSSSRYYPPKKQKIFDKECDRLPGLGVIEQIPRDPRFYSNHNFYKVKPDGNIHLIFDMKNLNISVRKPSFSTLKSK